jgi:hypothetical protein
MMKRAFLHSFLVLFLSFPAWAASTEGLVACYPLEGCARDESGHGHDGTALKVSLAVDRFGNRAGAYRFNGADSVITIPSLVSLDPCELTLSAWIKPLTAPASWGPIVTKWRGYSQLLDQFHLTFQPNLHIGFANGRHGMGYSERPNHCYMQSSNALSLAHWYHIVATLDSTGRGRIWINGVQAGEEDILPLRSDAAEPVPPRPRLYRFGTQQDPESSPALNAPAPEPVRIGQMIADDGRILETFSGFIGDVRIYSRALSGAEVRSLYGDGKKGKTGPPKVGSSTTASQVTIELRDGSRLVGRFVQDSLSFHSATLGDLRLPVSRIRSLEWPQEEQTVAHLEAINGDELRVSLTTRELRFKTG